ncbi:MAG: c-type cytochrome [Burkholderiales bacterium]|nr:c-type cytochrome [Burkholderiales bacterium]
MYKSVNTRVQRRGATLWTIATLLAIGLTSPVSAQTTAWGKLGRTATPAEIKAWDIDVRPDFAGLPAGSGAVSKGQDVWESRCESCHGTFGESNEVFTPIIGGTTAEDIKTGHVAALRNDSQPQRSTMMKVSQLSVLWDYINRAMPWNQPKSLSTDEVYAVVAYILNMAGVVPNDFVLSDKNIAATQGRLPNRNGTTLAHGMWDVAAKPDVQGSNCMTNCATSVTISSRLPDYARNAHGDIATQNRLIGSVRGADTLRPAAKTFVSPAERKPATAGPAAAAGAKPDPVKLANQHACMACHGVANKVVGPALQDVHKKYSGQPAADVARQLAARIKAGGTGTWGNIPMPPQGHVPDADIQAIAEWIANGKF